MSIKIELTLTFILQAIKSLQVLQRTENQWNRLVMKIFDLEDTLKNQVSRDRRFKKTFEKEKGWLSNIQVIPVLGNVF